MTDNKFNIPIHGSSVDRKDIPGFCKWHVEDIYTNVEAWRSACSDFKNKLPELTQLQGTISDGQKLLKVLRLQDELGKILEKIYAYACLQRDSDNTNQSFQAMAGEAESLVATYSNSCSFIDPELLALGQEKITSMQSQEPELKEYAHYIENLMRSSKHILSADKEAILAQSRLAISASASNFRALVSADMKFPEITDGEGNAAVISEGNYMLNMTSDDRELRKNSFTALLSTYHSYRNTLASTLTGSARAAFFSSTVRNHPNTLEASLFQDNIPVSLYDGLIETVHDNLTLLHDYIQLKKDILGYDELHFYDLYVPISKAADSFACDFEEACDIVEKSVAPLGEEYVAALHKGLTQGWIDVYENKGKRSGAYSWGVYGVHPFVLLNYQHRYNSISTLAHEMGHALHSYFSSSSQNYINADYTIFCAEVASTTNENLLLEHVLKHATEDQKIYLLSQFLESVRTTVYRQVQFAEFEKYIHSEITAGKSLQAEALENYWLDSNKRYYGPALTLDPELSSEWSRIPHFYTPFYVYKYATGFSAATAFSSAILSSSKEAVDNYLGFLHAGGSDYSLNILKKAGVDLTTPQPVTVTLQKFAEKLAELKELLIRKNML